MVKDPLMKRLPRELKQEKGKYIALFLFLCLTVGFCSGFLVADGSMQRAYDDSFTKYTIEDGHFSLAALPEESFLDQLQQDCAVTLFPLFYLDKELENTHIIRLFSNREDVNRASVLEGALPTAPAEIAIDRLYAENNGITVGDQLTVEQTDFTVCGLVALSDYSALFKNNTDMMFDAKQFTVALVTQDTFDTLGDSGLHYCYAWRNLDQTLALQDRRDLAENLMESAAQVSILTDFVMREDNQAIVFTGSDMGSDKVMIAWLLYIVMVVLAFVFAVTTRNTMEQEASVIGTLRASGYTRGELLLHYLILPLSVTLVAAVFGNVLGYTWMKQIVVGMYYHSYSLPTYETVWNAEAFLLTTVIPCLIILAVNILILVSTLSLPPLQFLRHELKRRQKKRVVRLPRWRFFTRFRLRIILQNLTAYLTMFVGILLASVLLIFGMMMSPLLSHFKAQVLDSKIADYQYILKAPVETVQQGAEKYDITALQNDAGEEITVFGIRENSAYLPNLSFPEEENSVILSDGYLEKYGLAVGDTLTLQEKYQAKSYTFTVAGSYHYPASLSVFLPSETFHHIFHWDVDAFSGYFSNEKLADLEDGSIASVITQHDLVIIADQLEDSMGAIFPMFGVFSVMLYVLVIYLLAKLIVEKNARFISMLKILGYTDGEAGALYNTSTALVVGLSLLLSLPISCSLIRLIYYAMMQEFNGWLSYYIAPWIYPAMLAIGAGCYAVVHVMQMRKVRGISLSQALKNME